ncbi:hypothetical protein BDQ94DRAFT_166105 [Aspergillus welwitschiae]|uniref:N-acetyltransferase domain-containing protein n=1 Tax=Aspergillus welwitschiae TaxID=1341132 RepID=A0A3F3QFL6_9EURO|nr:hypothetical protein BDQ94DRAFT_166105 [Aspergillus welwitschiae]RDH37850.1 hypothetical protein BDQ94DRAFT_166105 [Aspergillus welwitschiae]
MESNEVEDITIIRGTLDAVPAVSDLLDTAVQWLVSHNRAGQWEAAPFSENSDRVEQFREFATTGQWSLACWTLAFRDRSPYVSPVSEPELYVRLLVTDRPYAGNQIGKRLLDHARDLARKAGVSLLRVNCYAGGDGKLVRYYEFQGFQKSEDLNREHEWPYQVLAQRLDEMDKEER